MVKDDRRLLRVSLIELDRALELLELSADLGDEMTNGEQRFGVRRVDREGPGRSGGGG